MKRILQALIISITVFSCSKENDAGYPLIFTGDVVNIKDTTATFTAKITQPGSSPVIESGFIWSVHSEDDNGIRISRAGGEEGIYSMQTNEKLLPGMTYYVRAYVMSETAITYGREVSFDIEQVFPADTGTWTMIYDDKPYSGWLEQVTCVFTQGNVTYLVFSYGNIYQYDHLANTFSYAMTSDVVSNASFSVIHDGTAYVFAKNAFHRFNPANMSFETLATLGGGFDLIQSSGFLIGDEIYIGLGVNHYSDYITYFWKYSINTDTWQQTAPFPADGRAHAVSFSLKNTGYIGAGYNLSGNYPYPHYNDLWQYIPENDQWIQRENIPFDMEGISHLGTSTDESGYLYYQDAVIEYNPVFDFWKSIAGVHVEDPFFPQFLFAVQERLYLVNVVESDGEYYFRLLKYEK